MHREHGRISLKSRAERRWHVLGGGLEVGLAVLLALAVLGGGFLLPYSSAAETDSEAGQPELPALLVPAPLRLLGRPSSQTFSFLADGIPESAFARLQALETEGAQLQAIGFTAVDGWAIAHSRGLSVNFLGDPPADFDRRVRPLVETENRAFRSIAFGQNSTQWMTVYDVDGAGVPVGQGRDDLQAELAQLPNGAILRSVALHPSTSAYVVNWNDNDFAANNATERLIDRLTYIKAEGQLIRAVSLGPAGRYSILTATRNGWYCLCPQPLQDALTTLRDQNVVIRSVSFPATGNGWTVFYSR